MTIPRKSIFIYNWFDIQEAICKEMGIAENQFSDYHHVVGGDYKDLWHVCLDMVIPERMSNDTIIRMYKVEEPFVLNPDVDWGWNKYIKKKGDWVIPFIKAYQKVFSELNGDSDHFYVEFSW
jgi:hypothetical protein